MRITSLHNQHIQAVKGQEQRQDPDSNSIETVDIWTVTFTDRGTGDQVKIGFGRDARDELVRKLTDGIVLAGGGFPKI